ncbi:hypothetical protein Aca07nite_03260 [Actinoplanes capillaceus]|uniref:Solute-binding protein family 3/N-terminal domain-containing protein n=2 Tax=Actinoplanes campanulatus TaxID=113559 RepID=A0ABQ3W7N6_9ACTN|nr:hypothetical protein Aca07nite_03260 [Actinoplanes capillaceus]
MVVILGVTTAAWWKQREPDPFEFLSGTVRIGYRATQYDGWHSVSGRGHAGFEVAVVEALQRRFDFKVSWVPLDDLDDRIEALRGTWHDLHGTEQEPVKLVISNFSITSRRAEKIDFAGPYFVDRQGYLSKTKATKLIDLPTDSSICTVRGSTSSDFLDNRGWSIVERPSLDACISEFKQGTVTAVTGDSSALAGFAIKQGLNPAEYIAFASGAEEYGVGIPNNSPRLCAAVSETIEKFLSIEWNRAFAENLKPIGLHIAQGPDDPNGVMRPSQTDVCKPAQPWKQK